ncbi:hypothetical protein NC652_010348 [Populus alba x Populus x berolinensis]|nr:hypothetical protein NC652_010348 [Populus alba x Populus x berolinensis]
MGTSPTLDSWDSLFLRLAFGTLKESVFHSRLSLQRSLLAITFYPVFKRGIDRWDDGLEFLTWVFEAAREGLLRCLSHDMKACAEACGRNDMVLVVVL